MLNHSRMFTVAVNTFVTLFLLMSSATFSSSAPAASIITVATNTDGLKSNGLCSLREAITKANKKLLDSFPLICKTPSTKEGTRKISTDNIITKALTTIPY